VVSLLNQPISTKKSLIESFPYLRIHYYIFSLPRNGALSIYGIPFIRSTTLDFLGPSMRLESI
jgi:hypothetical protein